MRFPMTLAAMLLAATASAQHEHGAQPAQTPTGPATAGERAQPAAGPHGGTVHRAGALRVETVLSPGGMRAFAYNAQGEPLELSGARGLATLRVEGDVKRRRYDLFPETRQDGSAASLAAAVDLSRIAGQPLAIDFQLVGVPGAQRRPVRFTANATAPMTEAQRVAAAIKAQGTCPVSGQPLGSMGDPIPVQVGAQTVYVCCAGCVDAVKADPAKYVTSPEPKLTVAAATEADAAAVARQKVCPVTDMALDSMGGPVKVTGLGRDVFLCCEGCLGRLKEEPAKYLAKLPAEKKPQVVKATAADARAVAAQKVCPVMDAPLDSMGGPYKTVVEGRVVYLCCPGCGTKLHASPAEYLAKLADQGVTPPPAKR